MTFRELLGNKGFYLRVCGIALPIAFQSLITIGVNMVDNIMLGSLGEVALSAAALANQFISIYQICCMGIGMGASVLVSRFWGMKDLPSLKKTVTIMLRLCFFFGLMFTLATAVMPSSLMRIYTKEAAVITEGTRYFFWSVPTYLLLGLSLTCTIVLRSIGKAKVPLICSVFSFSANVLLNWMLIFGKLGAPRMEVAGAALATMIARLIEFLSIMGYFLFYEKELGYRIRDILLPCRDLLGEYLRISIPVLVSDGLLAVGNSAVAMIMGRIGSDFVSANSITSVTQQLTTVFVQGIAQAGCIITGHTLGEGDRERAQREGYHFLVFGVLIGTAACLLIRILREPVIGLYNITDDTKAIARALMDGVSLTIIFMAANSILTKGVLRGGGDTKFLMAADILFLWVASIPLGYLAGLVWHLPAFWVFVLLRIDQIIKCVWCVWRLRSGKWIKTIEKRN